MLWSDEYSPILQMKGGYWDEARMDGMEGRRMECGSDVRCIEDTKDRSERIYWGISIAKRNRRRVRRALVCIALRWSCRRGLCTDIFQNESAEIYILARKTSVSTTF